MIFSTSPPTFNMEPSREEFRLQIQLHLLLAHRRLVEFRHILILGPGDDQGTSSKLLSPQKLLSAQ
jgi:hypothetical protein